MQKVKLGKYANIFHDQYTGITINRGEVKELNIQQLKSPRIAAALQGGHLAYATEAEAAKSKATKQEDPLDVEKLLKAFKSKVEKGKTTDKLAKEFTLDQLNALCQALKIEIEEGDTEKDLIEAIYGVLIGNVQEPENK